MEAKELLKATLGKGSMTSVELAGITNLMDLLNYRAENQPNKTACVFLENGETQEVELTYNELHKESCAIAAKLQTITRPGDRALLLYPSGLDFIAAFFGCLYAKVIAVPVYPPDPTQLRRSMSRLNAIVKNAEPVVALTTSEILKLARCLPVDRPDFVGMQWMATDEVPVDMASVWKRPEVDSKDLAFLQYTSGSTGMPKGVMVSHGNVMHNEKMIKGVCKHTEGSISVSWVPFYHDMGVVSGILQPIYCGGLSVFMSPISFLQKPFRWLQAISRYRAATSGGPNFAYELCISKVTPKQCDELNLSSWKVAFSSAEPVRAETVKRFIETFEPCRFRKEAFLPCYGMAEATLLISGELKTKPPTILNVDGKALEGNRVILCEKDMEGVRAIVGCGHRLLDEKIVITEPEMRSLCPDGMIGEIWVAGSNITSGYWNNPEATRNTFEAYLTDTGEGPFMRTGDMGFMHNGELFITGRLKDMIIIRGQNHYPNDIEQTVEKAHPALRLGCTAAFSVEADGEERLVVVQELKTGLDKQQAEEVIEAIRKAITGNHELQVYSVVLIKSKTIPKTSSGKIQRKACRGMFLNGELTVEADWKVEFQQDLESESVNILEQLAAAQKNEYGEILIGYIQREIVKVLELAPSQLPSVQQGFLDMGIDSLAAVELRSALEISLDISLPENLIFKFSTIKELAEYLLTQIKK